MKPIKLGIIGLGRRAISLADALQSHGRHLFEITAVCDTYANKLHSTLERYNLPQHAGVTDYRDLIGRDDIEAVMVETGAQVMAPICCDALRAGKHVLCDVPMIFTLQDAWDLVVTVEQTGLVYCMAEQVRFANFVGHWKHHIAQGDIGEPLFIEGEYIHPLPERYFENIETGEVDWQCTDPRLQAGDARYRKTWRNTFTHPIQYISHELSPLLKILDDRIVTVSCSATDARSYENAVDMLDLECALLHTARGRTMRIVNSFTAPRGGEYFHHWYHILGTDGVLETARHGWGLEGEIIRCKDGSIERTNYGWDRVDDNPFKNFSGGHGGLEAFVFQEFYEAIRDARPSESDVYATVESTLPGIIAAQSALGDSKLLQVPNIRPNAKRPKGNYSLPQ